MYSSSEDCGYRAYREMERRKRVASCRVERLYRADTLAGARVILRHVPRDERHTVSDHGFSPVSMLAYLVRRRLERIKVGAGALTLVRSLPRDVVESLVGDRRWEEMPVWNSPTQALVLGMDDRWALRDRA